ncbi:hypothetical protein MNV49_004388 [Pseudohyphozyma bogoriensis]|nr:hypothetical protein MNV49_004388 [Pseudohyphozyma bogoriensis]
MSSAFLSAVESRRTIYALGNTLSIPESKVLDIVNTAVKHSPTSFNSQSSRVLVLFGEEHVKLWGFAKAALKAILPAEAYPASEQRLSGFEAGAGTVILFEDKAVVKGLQDAMPMYAEKFPQWAGHATGILAYVLWTALEAEGLGANLQHYNPLIDADVVKTWGVPESWEITGQLVFGDIKAPAGDKTFKPLEERVKVAGAKSA